MVDTLAIFEATARNDIRSLRRTITSLKRGRGSGLKDLLTSALDRLEEQVEEFAQSHSDVLSQDMDPELREQLVRVISRRFERLQGPLEVLYETLGLYSKSIDQSEVPVGLQHVVDGLVRDILDGNGDPMIHLDPIDMYSTIDLVAYVDEQFIAWKSPSVDAQYDGPRPIVFNLPALDPSNALLSPLIAHEVSHTAVDRTLMAELERRCGAETQNLLEERLSAASAVGESASADDWAFLFRRWCEELICDVIALALTGPSFLYAFSCYAPPTNVAVVNTHPPLRDRLSFHLRVLDQLGWTDVLTSTGAATYAWWQEIADEQLRVGSERERFLFDAIALVEEALISVSVAHVSRPLRAETMSEIAGTVDHFRAGVPNIETAGGALDTWQVVLAGWVAALLERGDAPTSLLAAMDDPGYSRLLIKALEMSSIVSKWKEYSSAG